MNTASHTVPLRRDKDLLGASRRGSLRFVLAVVAAIAAAAVPIPVAGLHSQRDAG